MTDPGGRDDVTGVAFQMDRLREVAGGDPDLERELIDLFLSELSERTAALEAAIEESAFEALGQEAHGLNGASGNVGAVGIQEIARGLEQDGIHHDRDGALRSLERLKTASSGLRRYLETEAARRRVA